MAPHSSTLAWKIPWMEESGRLQSMGSHRVGHNWATSLSLFTLMHWRRKWQSTPIFLPGESQGLGSLMGCRLWGHTELDTTEVTQQQQQQQQQQQSVKTEILIKTPRCSRLRNSKAGWSYANIQRKYKCVLWLLNLSPILRTQKRNQSTEKDIRHFWGDLLRDIFAIIPTPPLGRGRRCFTSIFLKQLLFALKP